MADMNILDIIAILLLIAGGINWGLIGLLDYNLIYTVLKTFPLIIENLVYALIGISAIYSAVRFVLKLSD